MRERYEKKQQVNKYNQEDIACNSIYHWLYRLYAAL